ncbi:hypothetical protein GP2_017_00010, partial [Gordonia paraffinivorans NBRC 108238]
MTTNGREQATMPPAQTHQPQSGWMSILAVLVAIGIATVSALVLISTPSANAETPAERCARETAAYNSAWAQSWAASNGKPADQAPPPPVPYVCVDPGPPTSSTTPPPSVTAPAIPTETNSPDTGGPNVGAHAPTDIPEAGQTPIVPVPGADRDVPVVPRSTPPSMTPALPPVPRIPLPGRTFARDWTPDSGLPPFAACGSSDERKEIQDYEVAGDRRAFMRCGNKKYSFEHIKGKHGDQWETKADLTGDKWMDLMHMSIKETLANPEVTELQKPEREGYSG